MKKKSTQAGDRKRVLAAILAEQKYVDARDSLDGLENKANGLYERLVEGKDLAGLLDLKKVFEELEPSFEKPEGFGTTLQALQDRIDDYTSGRMEKAAKA